MEENQLKDEISRVEKELRDMRLRAGEYLLENAAQNQQIEELQKTLSKEKDSRKEERFFYFLSLIILLDIIFFTFLPSWPGPIILLILQLLVLIPLARRMGLDEVIKLWDQLLDVLARIARGKD